MTTMAQLKEIKGLLTAAIAAALIIMAIGAKLMEWRISVNVAAALSAQDLGTDSKIVAMDAATAAVTATAASNKDNIEDNERRVEQAFAVLLGRSLETSE